MIWVAFLREKSQAMDRFKVFKERVENEVNLTIKCLRSYRAGEFTSSEFNAFCEEHDIKRYFSAPRTPE